MKKNLLSLKMRLINKNVVYQIISLLDNNRASRTLIFNERDYISFNCASVKLLFIFCFTKLQTI